MAAVRCSSGDATFFSVVRRRREACQFKLIGICIDACCNVLVIVPPHIVDDANLHIETMVLAMRVWTEEREAAGEPAQMPAKAHFQVDGASTNWCKAPIGFLLH